MRWCLMDDWNGDAAVELQKGRFADVPRVVRPSSG
jgi:hypothetical protein